MPFQIIDKPLEAALLEIGAEQHIPTDSKAAIASGILWLYVKDWMASKPQPPAPSSSSGGANGETPAGPTVHAHTDIASPDRAGLPSLTDSSAAKPDSRGGQPDERG